MCSFAIFSWHWSSVINNSIWKVIYMKEIDKLREEKLFLEYKAVELQKKYAEITNKIKTINRRITLYVGSNRNL